MKTKSILALLFMVATIAFCDGDESEEIKVSDFEEEEVPEVNGVKELTVQSFFTTVSQNDVVLVEFYAPWCGHCKQFAPTYEAIAQELKGRVTVARIDADTHSIIASLQELHSFPTIKLFVHGVPVIFSGPRTFDDVVAFALRGTEPTYTVLADADAHAAFLEAHPKSMVACFGENATEIGHLREMFEDIALQIGLTTDVSFAVFEDADTICAPSCPGFVAHNPDYEEPFVYDIGTYLDVEYDPMENEVVMNEDGKFEELVPPQEEDGTQENDVNGKEDGTQENENKGVAKRSVQGILTWLSQSMLPLVDEVSGRNFEKYASIDRPMVWLVVRESDDEIMKIFRDMASEFAYRTSFVWLNDTLYHIQSKLIGVPETSKFPTMVISYGRKNYVLPAEQSGSISYEVISDFVNGYFDGTLTPTVRSAPVPSPEENEKRPFKTIVRSQWEEMVLDPKKDVFVEFYSFWCSNCVALADMFGDLGKALGEIKSVAVGGIELSENDFPEDVEVKSFPHLVLFPAGENAKPVVYDQDIVLTKMIKFIHENAGYLKVILYWLCLFVILCFDI